MSKLDRSQATASSIARSFEELQQEVPCLAAAISEPVAAYYERKTESILRRYGRGPKVHFHAGFLDEPVNGETAQELRQKLHESQERMLRDASRPGTLTGLYLRKYSTSAVG